MVADIDNDNQAEILVGSSSGLRAFEAADGTAWANTRKIWNQHGYHITNINDDGSVPQYEEPSWLTHNTYRLNTFSDGRDPLAFPDLTAGHLRLIDNGTGQPYSVLARIGNAGLAPASATVTLHLEDGTVLATAPLADLASGAYRDVQFDGITQIGQTLYVTVDSANTVAECNEANNTIDALLTAPANPPLLNTAVTADKTAYGPDENAGITYSVANAGSFPADARVSVSIADAENNPVAEVDTRTLSGLAGGASLNFDALWNSGTALSGDYTVRVTVSDAEGAVLSVSEAPFAITADLETEVTLRTTTDKPAYHSTDTVNIDNLLQNLTANVLTDGITLTVSITAPDGTEVYSVTVDAGQLAPQATQSVLTAYALQNAAPGEYTVSVGAYSGDTPLAEDSSTFTVFNDLAVSISGETGVAAAECYRGEPQSCTDIVRNSGSEDVAALPVRQLLVSLDSATEAARDERALDLAAGTEAFLDRPVETALLPDTQYACVLQANWDETWHTLGWAAFRLKGAPCGIYTVHNEGEKDSQILFIATESGEITPLGPEYPDYNLEGLAFNPLGSRLYAVAAQPESVLYEVNYISGELSLIGTIQNADGNPFESVTGLAFRADGTLWGYANKGNKKRRGIIQIDPLTGIAELRQADNLNIESLAWRGDILWLFKNKALYSWTDGGNITKRHQVNALPGNIEGLDALADGRLIISIHHGGHLNLYVIDPDQGRIDRERGFQTELYDNLEAVAVPWHCTDLNLP